MPGDTTYHDMRYYVETQKQQYSRELAEYTQQQRDIAREAMEGTKAKESLVQTPSVTPKNSSRA